MDRASLASRLPRLIVAQLSAYASDGPLAARGGSDTILQAVSGVMDQVGEASGAPTRVGFPVVDIVAGRDLTSGVLAALLGRALQGEGARRVEVSLLATASSLMLEAWQGTLLGLPPVERSGNLNAVHAPGGIYPCAQSTHLALVTLRDADWRRLCEVIDRPSSATDPELATNDQRARRRGQVDRIVVDGLAARPAQEWLTPLTDAGVLAGPVQSVSEVAADPALRALVPIVATAHRPDGRGGPVLGIPIGLAGLGGEVAPAPLLGEHTEQLLDELGFDRSERERLTAAGAISPAPSPPPRR